jgi:hypothetical protein
MVFGRQATASSTGGSSSAVNASSVVNKAPLMQPTRARRELTRRGLMPLAGLAFAALAGAAAPRVARGVEPAGGDRTTSGSAGAVRVVERQHPDDAFAFEPLGDRLVVRVRSASGIGRVTLAAERGRWPAAVSILLEGFGELEDFELASGGLRVQGGRRESGRLPRFALPTDDTTAAARAAATPVGTLDVRIEKTAAGVLVTLPRDLLGEAGAERATIRWVDWLRR